MTHHVQLFNNFTESTEVRDHELYRSSVRAEIIKLTIDQIIYCAEIVHISILKTDLVSRTALLENRDFTAKVLNVISEPQKCFRAFVINYYSSTIMCLKFGTRFYFLKFSSLQFLRAFLENYKKIRKNRMIITNIK